MIAPDLNLLVYSFNASARQHEEAARWWEDLLNSNQFVGVPWVVYVGFVRLMSGRHVLVEPYTPAELLRLTGLWFAQPNVQLLAVTPRTMEVFQRLVGRYEIAGGMITDAAIAATAIEYQAILHTNDTDFARFSELRAHNPLSS